MKPATSTADLTNKVMIAVQQAYPGCRLWKMKQGGGYPANSIKAVKGLLQRRQYAEATKLLDRSPMVMFGGLNGLPDLDGILPGGRRLGIEIKFDDDIQQPAQKVCQRIYEQCGAVYVIARDVEGCLAELREKVTI